jgi:hypothetical protein
MACWYANAPAVSKDAVRSFQEDSLQASGLAMAFVRSVFGIKDESKHMDFESRQTSAK